MMTGQIQSTAILFSVSDGKRFSTSTPKTRLQVPAFPETVLRACDIFLVLLDSFEFLWNSFDKLDRETIKTGNLHIGSPKHLPCCGGRNAFRWFQSKICIRYNQE